MKLRRAPYLKTGKFRRKLVKICEIEAHSSFENWQLWAAIAQALRASHKDCASISQIFINFRRKLSVFKWGVRLNFTDVHEFSSKIVNFQMRNFVRNCQISKKERGVPCRSGRSVADSLFRPHPEQRARASRELQMSLGFKSYTRDCIRSPP